MKLSVEKKMCLSVVIQILLTKKHLLDNNLYQVFVPRWLNTCYLKTLGRHLHIPSVLFTGHSIQYNTRYK
jgi:hypothetical protein